MEPTGFSAPADPGPWRPDASAPPSRRARLAQAAARAALETTGVAALNEGSGHYVTTAGRERVPGVVAVAEPGGTYAVDVYVTADLVPLHVLMEEIKAAIREAAGQDGLEDALGAMRVWVLDVLDPAVDPDPAGR